MKLFDCRDVGSRTPKEEFEFSIVFERIGGAHDGGKRWIRKMTAPEVKRLCIATGDPFEIPIIQRVHDVLLSRVVRTSMAIYDHSRRVKH